MRRRMNLSLFLVLLALVPGNVMGANLRGKQVLLETSTTEPARQLHWDRQEHRRRLEVHSYWTKARVDNAIPRSALVDKPTPVKNPMARRRHLLVRDYDTQAQVPHRIGQPNQYLLSWGQKLVECTVLHEALLLVANRTDSLVLHDGKEEEKDSEGATRQLSNSKPKDRLISPPDGAILSTNYVDIVVEISDPNGGDDLAIIILLLDDFESVSQSTFSPDLGNGIYTFTVGPLKDGDFQWSVTAKDRRGKQSAKGVNRFTIDTSLIPPPPPTTTTTTEESIPTQPLTTTTIFTTTTTEKVSPTQPETTTFPTLPSATNPTNPTITTTPPFPTLPSVTTPTNPATTQLPPNIMGTTSTVRTPPSNVPPSTNFPPTTWSPPATDGPIYNQPPQTPDPTTWAPPRTEPTPPRTTPSQPSDPVQDVTFQYLSPQPKVTLPNGKVTFQWSVDSITPGAQVNVVLLRVQYPEGDEGFMNREPTATGLDSYSVDLPGPGSYSWCIWAQVNGGEFQKGPWQTFEVDKGPTDPACPVSIERYTNRADNVHKAVGRLMFKFGGQNYLCSGTLVDGGDDRAIIATAGHCLYDTSTRSFATNVMFIPGQDDGQSDISDFDCLNDPHGCIYPEFAVISNHYEKASYTRSFEYDYGFAVARDNHPGKDVGPDKDTFGGGVYKALKPMGISFGGMTLLQNGYLFGYPGSRDPMFMYTHGRLETSPVTKAGYYVECSGLTAGASGGPWTQSDPQTGEIVVSSVNSWGWTDGDLGMGAPGFETGGAECVYKAAMSANLNGGPKNIAATCPE